MNDTNLQDVGITASRRKRRPLAALRSVLPWGRDRGFTLTEVLIVVAVLAILAAFLLPAIQRSREQARLGHCISNLRQLYLALKIYEGDYGGLPVHYVEPLTGHWRAKLAPYTKNKQIFICPSDKTGGEVYRWGWYEPSSYVYFYTEAHVNPREGYRQPKITSPLVGCRSHETLDMILCRYDGSVEITSPGRYPVLQIQLE